MRVLFIGDITGRSGRNVVIEQVPRLRKQYRLDFVVANAENAAGGFGLTPVLADELFAAGIDCITSGNHIWDQKEIIPTLDAEPRLLRPLNYPEDAPGHGTYLGKTENGQTVLVINAMGRTFMEALDCPFRCVDTVLKKHPLGKGVDFTVIDMHAEATSEKAAMGVYADGRASLVVGTHSHVPTADARILPKGTAYQSDAGMCGDYNSILGMDPEEALQRFLVRVGKGRYKPAMGEGTLCAVLAESDDETGFAHAVYPIHVGGMLQESLPPAPRKT